MKKRWSVLAALFLTAGLTACAGTGAEQTQSAAEPPSAVETEVQTENQAEAQTGTPEETVFRIRGRGRWTPQSRRKIAQGIHHRTGRSEQHHSLAPATTQILCDLGLADKIVAVDTNSPQYAEELTEDVMQFDMMEPDLEQILNAEPDIIFVSNMSSQGGDDIFKSVRDAGICVAEIPTSNSIEDVKEDVRFTRTVWVCRKKARSGSRHGESHR